MKTTTDKTISQRLAFKIGRDIIEGKYPVGSRLPTEHELSKRFGVSRHMVREALKRLDSESLGFLKIRQGSGAQVQEIGIELFKMLVFRSDGSVDPSFLKDWHEFRGRIFADAMRLAAERRTDDEVKAFRKCLDESQKAIDDPEPFREIARQLYQIAANISRNSIYRIVFATFYKFLTEYSVYIDPTFDRVLLDTFVLWERLCDALEERDPELSEIWARRIIAIIDERFKEEGNLKE